MIVQLQVQAENCVLFLSLGSGRHILAGLHTVMGPPGSQKLPNEVYCVSVGTCQLPSHQPPIHCFAPICFHLIQLFSPLSHSPDNKVSRTGSGMTEEGTASSNVEGFVGARRKATGASTRRPQPHHQQQSHPGEQLQLQQHRASTSIEIRDTET